MREAGRGLKPPSLHSTKLKEWPDGKIYHVISEGQNVMPGYAKQILADERWAVVHYVRALQRAKDAKERTYNEFANCIKSMERKYDFQRARDVWYRISRAWYIRYGPQLVS